MRGGSLRIVFRSASRGYSGVRLFWTVGGVDEAVRGNRSVVRRASIVR